MKRNYHQMLEQTSIPVNVDGIAYHDYGYYSPQQAALPPPPQAVLLSNPFPSPSEYDGYLHAADSMGYFTANRSLSEPFIHQAPTDSFCSASDSCSNSCSNVSLGPATPPSAPFKYPAIPITPSHVQPRQKAKRTATACEECRKRKQKCDGASPCQSCKEQKLECRYREVTPTKSSRKDNSIEKLFSIIEGFGKSMEAMHKRLEAMATDMERIERRLGRCCQCGNSIDSEAGPCHNCSTVRCRL